MGTGCQENQRDQRAGLFSPNPQLLEPGEGQEVESPLPDGLLNHAYISEPP